MKYWAIDYINKDECELVVGDQLYPTKEEAEAVISELPRPELHEVNWYGLGDLSEIYSGEVYVDDQLRVHYPHW